MGAIYFIKVALISSLFLVQANGFQSSYQTLLNLEWQTFKTIHGKEYRHPMQDSLRKAFFVNSKKQVAQHNLEAAQGKHSYTMGLNQFSDKSIYEIKDYKECYKRYRLNILQATFIPPANINIPKTVDWRKVGAVTEIKNQGQCGSCWAFSATGALEGQHFRKTGKLVSLSEENLVDCVYQFGSEAHNGCLGGSIQDAFYYIRDNKGIDTEESYPYTAGPPDMRNACHYSPKNRGATDSGLVMLSSNETELEIAVATVGPIAVGIGVPDSFMRYKSGVYDDEQGCNQTPIAHAVLVVGYGTDDGTGKDYWLVKNSWGEKWGEQGYIKMAKGRNNMCDISSEAMYPLV